MNAFEQGYQDAKRGVWSAQYFNVQSTLRSKEQYEYEDGRKAYYKEKLSEQKRRYRPRMGDKNVSTKTNCTRNIGVLAFVRKELRRVMAEFIRQKEVVTRKAHACDWCSEPIEAGGKAICTTSHSDGSVYDLYMHPECKKAYSKDLSNGRIDFYDDIPYEKHGQIRGETIADSEEIRQEKKRRMRTLIM